MATESNDFVGALGEVLGEQLEKQRKKAAPVPEIYTSGIRGNEKPPGHEDAKPKADKKPKAGEVDPKTGKKIVQFHAKPKVKSSERIAQLERELAEMKKQLGGKGKTKTKITI